MSKGNSKAYLNSNMVDNTEIDYVENENMINCVLESFKASKPDLHKPAEVEKAIIDYFNRCISKGLKPGNLGLYNALGMNKTEVSDLLLGRNPNKANTETIRLIKKAKQSLSEYRELLASQNRLSPPIAIFWQKNFDGLEDVQRVDVAPVNTLTADRTPEEIAAEIPVDTD